jgi:glycosyltransferase involved in cell wall biosynthesis
MKVSIITVVYNREKTIERAIQSVLNQTCPDIEYIVIDGSSTDQTLSIIKKYSSRIACLISEKDGGMYDALNKGISKATGELVGILHADDEFTNDHIVGEIVAFFKAHAHIDCLYGDVGFVSEKNPSKIIRYYSSAIFHKGLFKFGFMPAHPTFFCYRKYFEQFGMYRTDLEIAADFDLLLRFLKKNQLHAAYLPKMLVKMNLGGKSTKGISSTLKINKEIKKILTEQQMPSSYLRLYSRYIIKVQEFWKNKNNQK